MEATTLYCKARALMIWSILAITGWPLACVLLVLLLKAVTTGNRWAHRVMTAEQAAKDALNKKVLAEMHHQMQVEEVKRLEKECATLRGEVKAALKARLSPSLQGEGK